MRPGTLLIACASARLMLGDGHALTPPCANVECGELRCMPPFVAASDGGCCPVCKSDSVKVPWKPTRDLSVYPTHSNAMECMGAHCFPLSCAAGQTPKLHAGRCCQDCDPPLDA